MPLSILHITDTNIATAATRAAEVVRQGGVILYPTDTVYGLGCDPANVAAVSKIAAIKQREADKMMIVIAASLSVVERYAILDDRVRGLAEHFWPGPLSLVLPRIGRPAEGALPDFYPHESTIVFRVPDHPFCQALLDLLDAPLVSTSANMAGMETCPLPTDILAQLGPLAQEIDLVLDAGEATRRVPSTLLSVQGGTVELLREGAITKAEISAVMKVDL